MTSAPSSGALTRYRVMAYVTGVVLATSCLLGLSFWPWYSVRDAAGWLWTAHGYLYIVYVVTAFLLALTGALVGREDVLVMAAGTIPLMSFVAERRVTADLHRAARSRSRCSSAARLSTVHQKNTAAAANSHHCSA